MGQSAFGGSPPRPAGTQHQGLILSLRASFCPGFSPERPRESRADAPAPVPARAALRAALPKGSYGKRQELGNLKLGPGWGRQQKPKYPGQGLLYKVKVLVLHGSLAATRSKFLFHTNVN